MKRRLRIMSVVAARPNFMKIAPFAHAVARRADAFEHRLVHTGQHYDPAMSDAFFRDLDLPRPDVHLEVGSGTHAEQVGRTMIAFERALGEWRPDWVVVAGDVNATCACAITAKKELLRLAHIEAGLRSFDMEMPEEVNRIVTDRLADLLLTPDAIADGHLRAEGAAEPRIRRVGNIMIDSLDRHRPAAAALDPHAFCRARALDRAAGAPFPELRDDAFAVLTLHRPSNVDDPAVLARLVEVFTGEVAPAMPLVWPLHPRGRKQLAACGLLPRLAACPAVILTEPLGYPEMLRLTLGARVMLTDSGGLQEECCVLGTPCLTLRWNTERPVTLREHGGTCALVGNDPARIRAEFRAARARPRAPFRPPLWDGETAGRIVACFEEQAAAQQEGLAS